MEKLIIFLFMISFAFGYSQPNEDDYFEFSPMINIGKISVNKFKPHIKADELNKKDFFFTENYKEEKGLFFIKKEKDNWVAYSFQLGLNFGSNTSVMNIKEETNRFISIQLSRSPSGMCSTLYRIILLIDILRNEYISFNCYNQWDCYNGNVEECKATFSIKGNVLKIKSSKKPNDGLYCVESGTYHYENGKFVRKK